MLMCFSTSSAHKATPENDRLHIPPPTRTSSKVDRYIVFSLIFLIFKDGTDVGEPMPLKFFVLVVS